ncbi:hypothetical protein HYH03_018900 [Edaphochlamys debaryana]|uniref:Uncharacterized protein n=1 Tax=Edaphochlamys debaryana TaxID=47281 RepID=A0A836BMH1_9CHLO|nr:hypothetical protein HYH03_018900 [Edaphochlamys debaryana]|eukprot:KAG2482141.1 hypothetical protein HYH03_018900 [Edaphochlamys debaryana]
MARVAKKPKGSAAARTPIGNTAVAAPARDGKRRLSSGGRGIARADAKRPRETPHTGSRPGATQGRGRTATQAPPSPPSPSTSLTPEDSADGDEGSEEDSGVGTSGEGGAVTTAESDESAPSLEASGEESSSGGATSDGLEGGSSSSHDLAAPPRAPGAGPAPAPGAHGGARGPSYSSIGTDAPLDSDNEGGTGGRGGPSQEASEDLVDGLGAAAQTLRRSPPASGLHRATPLSARAARGAPRAGVSVGAAGSRGAAAAAASTDPPAGANSAACRASVDLVYADAALPLPLPRPARQLCVPGGGLELVLVVEWVEPGVGAEGAAVRRSEPHPGRIMTTRGATPFGIRLDKELRRSLAQCRLLYYRPSGVRTAAKAGPQGPRGVLRVELPRPARGARAPASAAAGGRRGAAESEESDEGGEDEAEDGEEDEAEDEEEDGSDGEAAGGKEDGRAAAAAGGRQAVGRSTQQDLPQRARPPAPAAADLLHRGGMAAGTARPAAAVGKAQADAAAAASLAATARAGGSGPQPQPLAPGPKAPVRKAPPPPARAEAAAVGAQAAAGGGGMARAPAPGPAPVASAAVAAPVKEEPQEGARAGPQLGRRRLKSTPKRLRAHSGEDTPVRGGEPRPSPAAAGPADGAHEAGGPTASIVGSVQHPPPPARAPAAQPPTPAKPAAPTEPAPNAPAPSSSLRQDPREALRHLLSMELVGRGWRDVAERLDWLELQPGSPGADAAADAAAVAAAKAADPSSGAAAALAVAALGDARAALLRAEANDALWPPLPLTNEITPARVLVARLLQGALTLHELLQRLCRPLAGARFARAVFTAVPGTAEAAAQVLALHRSRWSELAGPELGAALRLRRELLAEEREWEGEGAGAGEGEGAAAGPGRARGAERQ